MNKRIGLCDAVSVWNAINVSILLRVSFYFISVTKLWDMIIRQCMCKGRIGCANVLDCKSHPLTANERDIVLPIVVKFDNEN